MALRAARSVMKAAPDVDGVEYLLEWSDIKLKAGFESMDWFLCSRHNG